MMLRKQSDGEILCKKHLFGTGAFKHSVTGREFLKQDYFL